MLCTVLILTAFQCIRLVISVRLVIYAILFCEWQDALSNSFQMDKNQGGAISSVQKLIPRK